MFQHVGDDDGVEVGARECLHPIRIIEITLHDLVTEGPENSDAGWVELECRHPATSQLYQWPTDRPRTGADLQYVLCITYEAQDLGTCVIRIEIERKLVLLG